MGLIPPKKDPNLIVLLNVMITHLNEMKPRAVAAEEPDNASLVAVDSPSIRQKEETQKQKTNLIEGSRLKNKQKVQKHCPTAMRGSYQW